jgi:archaemetzincin
MKNNTYSGCYTSPSPEERINAAGPPDTLSAELRKAFQPGDDFKPIPVPGPYDWLAIHNEPGQTYNEYVDSLPVKPDKKRNIVYLQPIGSFPDGESPSLSALAEFSRVFFTLEVEVTSALPPQDIRLTTRINRFTRKRQILTTDILVYLMETRPSNGFCILAITMEDLYPDPTWNFVFGQASLRNRVGVFSLARYSPSFYGETRMRGRDKGLLFRSCKVLAHEAVHMFGLPHCIYYHCLMNGSNHLAESDARPLHLCPVCLKKLYYCIDFDPLVRYNNILQFHLKNTFHEEAEWTQKRLEVLVHGE